MDDHAVKKEQFYGLFLKYSDTDLDRLKHSIDQLPVPPACLERRNTFAVKRTCWREM